jgi:HK97 family phage portal protein
MSTASRGIFARVAQSLGIAPRAQEERGSMKLPEKWMMDYFGGYSGSGPVVGETAAMQIAAFFACVQRISTDIAKLPLEIYKTTSQNGKPFTQVDQRHPAYWLVHDSPNNRDTSIEMLEMVIAESLIRGVGYILIRRDINNDPISLWGLNKNQIREKFSYTGESRYYEFAGQIVPEDDVIAIRNFKGTSAVKQFNKITGLSYSADEYAVAYFKSGGSISGILEAPGKLDDGQVKNLESQWSRAEAMGHSVKMLPNGIKYNRLTQNADASQLVDSRQFNAEDICRVFGVHPSIIGYKTDAKYESAEAMMSIYLSQTLLSHIKRAEQQLNKRLLRSYEIVSHAFKFNINALMRANTKERTEHYNSMLGRGVYNINEVRSMENLNPIEGGDLHMVQVNQIPISHMDEYGQNIASGKNNTSPGNDKK